MYKNVARVKGSLNMCEHAWGVSGHEVLVHPWKNVRVHSVSGCRDWSKHV